MLDLIGLAIFTFIGCKKVLSNILTRFGGDMQLLSNKMGGISVTQQGMFFYD